MKRLVSCVFLTLLGSPAFASAQQVANTYQCQIWAKELDENWGKIQDLNTRLAIKSRPDFWRAQYARMRDGTLRQEVVPDFSQLSVSAGMQTIPEATLNVDGCDTRARLAVQNRLLLKVEDELRSSTTTQGHLEKLAELQKAYSFLADALAKEQCESRLLSPESKAEAARVDPVVGCWEWSWVMLDGSSGKATLTLGAGGSAALSAFGLRGSWSCTGNSCRIDWGRGAGNEDILTLSGQSLAGKNTQTKSISGRKTACP